MKRGQASGRGGGPSRIDATFERLRAVGERALVAYFTGGDPSLADTRRLMVEADRQGADVIELGIPFSDPVADGPVIQRAAERALRAGTSVARVLEMVAGARAEVRAPIVFLTYYNPVLAFGLEPFAQTAAKAGVDGVIVADLPPEESDPLAAAMARTGLDLVHLVAPTSTPERVRMIARRSAGFIYLVALTGVTGERSELPPDLAAQIRTLRAVTTKPICVGFGISRPEHVAAVGRIADGVIVGSAIVRMIEERAGTPSLIEDVGAFIASLKAPLRSSARGTGRGSAAALPLLKQGDSHGSAPAEPRPAPRAPDAAAFRLLKQGDSHGDAAPEPRPTRRTPHAAAGGGSEEREAGSRSGGAVDPGIGRE